MFQVAGVLSQCTEVHNYCSVSGNERGGQGPPGKCIKNVGPIGPIHGPEIGYYGTLNYDSRYGTRSKPETDPKPYSEPDQPRPT